MLNVRFTSLIAISASCALLAGCSNPRGGFDDFGNRVIDANTDHPDAPMLLDIPDVTGEFLWAMDPSPQPGSLFFYQATLTLTKGTDSTTLMISLQPLDFMTLQPVGDPSVPDPNPVEVSQTTGEFVAPVTGDVPGSANSIAGIPITASTTFDGVIRTKDFLCGGLNGAVTAPISIDLDGSTFAAVRIPDGMTAADVTPIANCDDFNPDVDAGVPDGGTPDAGSTPDASTADAASPDAGVADATPTDA